MTTRATIPLVDLALQHELVADEIAAGFARVIESSAYILGPEVGAFEDEFSAFMGARHCVGVANGTDAIEITLRAAEIGPRCEVIVPANTFVGTAEAVLRSGAELVLADCDPDHLLLDPEAVEPRLTPRTRAIIPVHLYGQMAPMGALAALGSIADAAVIEDAAQAHGARQLGHGPATVGLAATTSFYPGKNLGSYGDGGAVLTDDADLASRVRALSNHGLDDRQHRFVGLNSRLDSLQAVVLQAKLRYLEQWNADRRLAVRRYHDLLDGVDGVVLPRTAPDNEHVWHLYAVRVPHRDRVLADLRADDIQAGVHYEQPIHLQPAFGALGQGEGSFPVAEAASRAVLSLPLYPGITTEQQERVCESLQRAIARHGA
jgi:dTDP-4-amino-4,6-dideoxygalactose transaminase